MAKGGDPGEVEAIVVPEPEPQVQEADVNSDPDDEHWGSDWGSDLSCDWAFAFDGLGSPVGDPPEGSKSAEANADELLHPLDAAAGHHQKEEDTTAAAARPPPTPVGTAATAALRTNDLFLGSDPSEFHERQFWDRFYAAREGEAYEWYGSWPDIETLVLSAGASLKFKWRHLSGA
jgi:hypothetical protein